MMKRSTTCSERVVFVSNYWGCLCWAFKAHREAAGASAGPQRPLKAASFPYALY